MKLTRARVDVGAIVYIYIFELKSNECLFLDFRLFGI